MPDERPVHYKAHGRCGFRFKCYSRELQATIDSARTVTEPLTKYTTYAAPRTVYSVPWPLRHTDLTKVTCAECWRHIGAMARAAAQ